MSKDLVIQDVCDAVITELATGKVVANTKLQMSALEGTINEEDLRAGIGNGKIFKIRSEKDLSLNFRSAVFNAEWLAMTQGVEVKKDSIVVTRAETVCIEDGVFTLDGNPDGDVVKLTDENGEVYSDVDGATIDVAVADKVVDMTAILDAYPIAAATDEGVMEIQVTYSEKVEGDVIEFDAQTFSKKYKVELHTIAYDLDTAEIASDIYFIFPETMPAGDFSLSFEAGSVITPEIAFDVLQPKCGSVMGRMIDVPRPKKN